MGNKSTKSKDSQRPLLLEHIPGLGPVTAQYLHNYNWQTPCALWAKYEGCANDDEFIKWMREILPNLQWNTALKLIIKFLANISDAIEDPELAKIYARVIVHDPELYTWKFYPRDIYYKTIEHLESLGCKKVDIYNIHIHTTKYINSLIKAELLRTKIF